jgi:hypothetical protein
MTAPVRVLVLTAGVLVLLVGASLWVALGVLTARDARMKPAIQSCGIAPHVEVQR